MANELTHSHLILPSFLSSNWLFKDRKWPPRRLCFEWWNMKGSLPTAEKIRRKSIPLSLLCRRRRPNRILCPPFSDTTRKNWSSSRGVTATHGHGQTGRDESRAGGLIAHQNELLFDAHGKMKWSVVIFMPEISSEKPTSICIRARVKKVLWQSTKYCPLTKIRDFGTFRDIKISSSDLHPCMARANSCMQCNNPTGSFSFSSFLPFSPFWLLSTIFRWTANQSEDRDRRTIYDSLLQMSSAFHFH